MHGIEVVDEAFHGLESFALGIFVSSFDDCFREFLFLEDFIVAVVVFIFDVKFEFFVGKFVVFFEVALQGFAEGLVDTWSHSIVEVWNGLTTVLLVLVCLEQDSGKCSIGANRLRGAEETVASIEAFFKEF